MLQFQINTKQVQGVSRYGNQCQQPVKYININNIMQRQYQRKNLQDHAEELLKMKNKLKQFQDKIQKIQNHYLSRNWHDGNILLGWNKQQTQLIPANITKIKLTPKDKIFSMSSTTSSVNYQLTDLSNIADKNLIPSSNQRFQHKQSGKSRLNTYSKAFQNQDKAKKRSNSSEKIDQDQLRIKNRMNTNNYEFRRIKPICDYKNIEKN